MQVLNEDDEIYDATDRFIEGADWIVWQLTGEEKRNTCTAGYKGMWINELYQTVAYLQAQGAVEQFSERVFKGKRAEIYTYRYVNQVPLRAGADAWR